MGRLRTRLVVFDSYRSRLTALIVIHALTVITYGCCEWTYTLSVRSVLTDFGASYHAIKLIDNGLMPYRDFGYNYGGLGLILVDSFHKAFGFSLFNHALIMYLGALSCFALLYWFLIRTKPSIMTCAIMLATSLCYFSAMWVPAFMLEGALLTGVVILIYDKNLPSALLLASVSFFVRPAISVYFIAFIGCSLLCLAYTERSWRGLAKSIFPSLAASLVITAFIYARFGWPGVVGSLFPQSALAAYKNYDYGFHTLLGLFYDGSGLDSSLAGIITGKQFVLALYFFVFLRGGHMWIKRNHMMRIHQVALVVSVIYLLFLITMYGNSMSWLNYAYLLTWCLPISTLDRNDDGGSKNWGVLSLFVIIFSFIYSSAAPLKDSYRLSLINLNGNAVFLRDEYDVHVNALLRAFNEGSEKVLFLGWGGCANEIYPHIQTSKSWAVVAGVCRESEIEYVVNQIAMSGTVVELISVGSPTKIGAINHALMSREKKIGNEYILYKKVPR